LRRPATHWQVSEEDYDDESSNRISCFARMCSGHARLGQGLLERRCRRRRGGPLRRPSRRHRRDSGLPCRPSPSQEARTAPAASIAKGTSIRLSVSFRLAPRVARFIVVSSLDQFWPRHISALPASRPCCVARVRGSWRPFTP